MRRVPSRFLPRVPPPRPAPEASALVTVKAILGVGLLAIGGTLMLWALVESWPVMLILAGLYVMLLIVANRHVARMSEARRGESICTFARSFDCRRVDTWIVRAVYEQFAWIGYPLRASDHLENDLGIHHEDIDDGADVAARRAGRTLDGCEDNPIYGRVHTLRDLVEFLQLQPRVVAAAQ